MEAIFNDLDMDESTFDVKKICRTCLRSDTDLKSLFSEQGNEWIPISKMIEAFTIYPVRESYEYPNQICNKCIQDTKLAYAFKKKCEKSYETLRSMTNVCKTNFDQAVEMLEDDQVDIDFTVDIDNKEDLGFISPEKNCPPITELNLNSFKECEENFYISKSVKISRETHSLTTSKQNSTACHYVENETTNGNNQTKKTEYNCENYIQQFETEEELDDHQCEKSKPLTNSEKSTSSIGEYKITMLNGNESPLNIFGFEYDSDFTNDPTVETISTGEDDASDDDDKCLSQLYVQKGTIEIDSNKSQGNDITNELYIIDSSIEPKSKTKKKKLLKCEECGKMFPTNYKLKRHALTHSEQRPYLCEICSKGFTRVEHLNSHTYLHSDVRPFVCDICDQSFACDQHLRNHKDALHEPKPEICKICKKGYKSRKYLKIHMKNHLNRSWSCRVCSETFITKQKLSEHENKHSEIAKPFLCPECGLKFVRRDYLAVHLRRHNGEKPFKCRFCSKGFPRRSDLSKHEKYHTDDKKHVCTVCDKRFHTAYNLTVHTRSHTGEKPYQCPECPKSFTQSNDLKSHIRRHTGERFKCDICERGFIHAFHLTHHKSAAHGMEMKSQRRYIEKFTAPVERDEMIDIKQQQ